MSKLSELEHSAEHFLQQALAKVEAAIGKPIVEAALDGAADEIETVRAGVARVLDAYLQSHGLAGAEAFVDGLTHNLAGALQAVLRASRPA